MQIISAGKFDISLLVFHWLPFFGRVIVLLKRKIVPRKTRFSCLCAETLNLDGDVLSPREEWNDLPLGALLPIILRTVGLVYWVFTLYPSLPQGSGLQDITKFIVNVYSGQDSGLLLDWIVLARSVQNNLLYKFFNHNHY